MSATAKTKVQVMIPAEEFAKIFSSLEGKSCRGLGCIYSRATCRVNILRDGIREWWQKTNGNAPGFSCYESVCNHSIWQETAIFSMVLGRDGKMKPANEVHAKMLELVRQVFEGKPLR